MKPFELYKAIEDIRRLADRISAVVEDMASDSDEVHCYGSEASQYLYDALNNMHSFYEVYRQWYANHKRRKVERRISDDGVLAKVLSEYS